MNAVLQRLGAGSLDRRQAIGEHGAEDLTIGRLPSRATFSLRRIRSIPAGSTQLWKRRAAAERARLVDHHRHLVPGIADGFATPKRTAVVPDDPPVLP